MVLVFSAHASDTRETVSLLFSNNDPTNISFVRCFKYIKRISVFNIVGIFWFRFCLSATHSSAWNFTCICSSNADQSWVNTPRRRKGEGPQFCRYQLCPSFWWFRNTHFIKRGMYWLLFELFQCTSWFILLFTLRNYWSPKLSVQCILDSWSTLSSLSRWCHNSTLVMKLVY